MTDLNKNTSRLTAFWEPHKNGNVLHREGFLDSEDREEGIMKVYFEDGKINKILNFEKVNFRDHKSYSFKMETSGQIILPKITKKMDFIRNTTIKTIS